MNRRFRYRFVLAPWAGALTLAIIVLAVTGRLNLVRVPASLAPAVDERAVDDILLSTVVFVAAIVIDLARAQRAAESDLREASERHGRQLRALFADNPLPMWVYDMSTAMFLEVNDAAVHHYGFSRDEFLGMTLRDIRPEDEWERLRQSLAAPREAFQRSGSWRHRVKSGAIIDVEVTSHAMVFEGREAALVVAQDVTERKRLQQQFYQAQKMEAIGQLAGGVAHDFNNLLTGILGYCDLLLGNWPASHEGRDDLVEIQKAGVNAAALTRQLLAFSRKQILERRVADLNDVVADAAKMLHRLVREDIEIEVRQAPDLWRVHADVGQLNQVLVNLVVNARDAMPNGGRLTIETANATLDASYSTTRLSVTPGPYVMLAVTDEGEGMTPELQRRLFEPFFTTKGPGAGTGLGLATILGIVQQHEGGIQVYSEPGRGTTFKIYLPATEASADVVADTRAVLPMNGTETILVVEDQPSLVRLTTRILRARGYTVLGASSGAEAVRLAESHEGAIDLVVTDVVMPGESGPALAERLARRRPAMRVLCMSGYAPEAIVRHGLVRDGIAFIPKPFTPDGLAKKVREVLSAPARAQNA